MIMPSRSQQAALDTGSLQESELSLIYPRNMSVLTRRTVLFNWRRLKTHGEGSTKIRYVLRIYQGFSHLTGKPNKKQRLCFETEIVDGDMFGFKDGDLPLVSGKIYSWEVSAYDSSTTLISGSARGSFIYKEEPTLVIEESGRITRAAPSPELVPTAPMIWGCPVAGRFRTEIESVPLPPPDGSEPDTGGDTVPIAITWASPAAVVFLIPHTWRACNLYWDYTRIPGCERVILQIAEGFGFEYANNSPDVLSDPGVVAAYEGPVVVECHDTADQDLTRVDQPMERQASLAFNLGSTNIWADTRPALVNLRLVPIGADGAPVDIASDPTHVFCLEHWPGIELADCDVTWTWGETPRREIALTVRMQHDFPPWLFAGVPVDASFLIGANEVSLGHLEATVNDEVIVDGVPTTHLTRVTGGAEEYYAYVFAADSWEAGREYRCRLVQEWPEYHAYTIADLEDFADLRLHVYCYPGIGMNWPYCKGPLTAEVCELPRLADPSLCGGPALMVHDATHKAWESLSVFFNATFNGTRTVTTVEERNYPPEFDPMDPSPLVDPDLWTIETNEVDRVVENITVQFTFPGNPADGDAFHASLLRADDATMIESVDGDSRVYDFRWWGYHAELQETGPDGRRYHGESRYEMGRIIVGIPDALTMRFYCEIDHTWEIDHSLKVYEIIDYSLHT